MNRIFNPTPLLFLCLITLSSCIPKLERLHDWLLLDILSKNYTNTQSTQSDSSFDTNPIPDEENTGLLPLPDPILTPNPSILTGDTSISISPGSGSPPGTILRFIESGFQPNCNTIGVEYTTPVNILFTNQLHAIACHPDTQLWNPSNVVGGEYNHPRLNRIALGSNYTCALLASGNVRCWGSGFAGRLGYESTLNRGHTPGTMPPPDVNLGGTVKQISARYGAHTCALLDTGHVRCWGNGVNGRLGYESTANVGHAPGTMPPANVNVGGTVIQVTNGGWHTCALLDTGHVRCWGAGANGQLGYENTLDRGHAPGTMPPPNVNVGGTVKQITAGATHTCALMDSGHVRCWGNGANGQLGYENTSNRGDSPGTMPPPNVNVGGTVKQIAAGFSHTCALLDSGSVRCWGHGFNGRLGYENTLSIGNTSGTMPPPNVNLGGTVIQIDVGDSYTCALLDTGHVRCWGAGANGQLGYENTLDRGHAPGTMPPPNVNVGGIVKQVAAGATHTCALMDSGHVRCWGNGSDGRLGYENTTNIGHAPLTMPPPNVNY